MEEDYTAAEESAVTVIMYGQQENDQSGRDRCKFVRAFYFPCQKSTL
ncbi:hypothetical protein ACFQAT_10885 [Undibacterium arcticum]